MIARILNSNLGSFYAVLFAACGGCFIGAAVMVAIVRSFGCFCGLAFWGH